MPISPTKLQLTDSLGEVRVILNNNFTLLENTINSFTNIVNVTDSLITGVKYIEVANGSIDTPNTGITTISTNGNIISKGNIIAGNIIKSAAIELNNGSGLNVLKGNIQLNSSGIFINNGSLKNTGYYQQHFENYAAASRSTYTPATNYMTTISSENFGIIDVTGKSGIILDFVNYNSASSTFDINKIKFQYSSTNNPDGYYFDVIFKNVPTANIKLSGSTITTPGSTANSKNILVKKELTILRFVAMAGYGWVLLSSNLDNGTSSNIEFVTI